MSDPREARDFPELSEAYRRTPKPPAAARVRLDARIRSQPPPRHGLLWLAAGGALSLRPLAAAALAALLLVAGYALSWIPGLGRVAPRSPLAPDAGVTTMRDGSSGPAAGQGERVVEFVLVASNAASVSVVGDFNDWDPTRTPMRRVDRAGTWVARVPLAEGRSVYAFVVDGDRWVADPGAPLAPADEFGATRSVVVVSGSGI